MLFILGGRLTRTPIVFVVDDDAAIRDAVHELLSSVGHLVEAFPSAEEFLIRREPHTPGCVVLDVRLPGTSGLELQKRLVAQRDRFCKVPSSLARRPGGLFGGLLFRPN